MEPCVWDTLPTREVPHSVLHITTLGIFFFRVWGTVVAVSVLDGRTYPTGPDSIREIKRPASLRPERTGELGVSAPSCSSLSERRLPWFTVHAIPLGRLLI